jgi:hypothetical protein
MTDKKKHGRSRLLWVGVAASAAVAASAITLPGLAGAVVLGPPSCGAPEGSDCLSINNKTKNMHSVRSLDNNGQCITNVLPGKKTDVEQVFVPEGAPTINGFASNDCSGDTYPILITETKAGQDGYTLITVKDAPQD